MVMDNAAWHGSSITKKTENIVPLFQPPYSPELNPAEHIRHYIRESGLFKNRTFLSMNDVEEQLILAVNTLLSDKDKLKSITCFN
jgi:transposase